MFSRHVTVQDHSSPPLPLAMASEADVPAPTVTVDNAAASIANGSADGGVIPNGNGVSRSEVTPPPVHDQVASAGTVECMTYSLKSSDHNFKDTISQDEVALYDRQIRLWGLQAQEKLGSHHHIKTFSDLLSSIRKANVLLISAKALANEIAKNLVLAGIGALTIIDPEVVTEMDLGAQFFVTEADIGRNVR
jgi:ubiquitin-like 1-activating enzyme E1 A